MNPHFFEMVMEPENAFSVLCLLTLFLDLQNYIIKCKFCSLYVLVMFFNCRAEDDRGWWTESTFAM